MFESLEMRRLLSVSLVNHTLSIEGTDDADRVALSAADGTLFVDLNGQVQSFAAAEVKSIRIRLGAGDDYLSLGNIPIGAMAKGGAGDDTLLGSPHSDSLGGGAGADSIAGMGGNDWLIGGIGADTISGGSGADWINGARGADVVGGGRGADRLLGGRGIDQLRGGHGRDLLLSADHSTGDDSDGGDGSDTASYDSADRLTRMESRQRAGGVASAPVEEELANWLTDAAARSYSRYFGRAPKDVHYWYRDVRLFADTAALQGTYSQTNVQVAGVDEADLVETDGQYLYFISGNDLVIADAAPEKLDVISRTTIGGTPTGIYLYGDRITVLSGVTVYDDEAASADGDVAYSYWPVDSRVQVTVVDVSNRAVPVVAQEAYVDGSLVSSRQIDGRLYLVVSDWLRMPEPALVDGPEGDKVYEDEAAYRQRIASNVDEMMPRYWVQTPDGQELTGTLAVASDMYLQDGDDFDNAMTSVVLFDTTGPASAPKSSVSVLGDASTIYASADRLYLTNARYDWDGETGGRQSTDIWQLSLGAEEITLQATGNVEGRVLNQFSMDEHEGAFRIATTKGWGTQASNAVYVLQRTEDQLAVVGQIADLGAGESIQSVRFMGDRGYVVTFRQTDPLFTLDLSDATNPRMVGELVIPGFSRYLHPAGENLLLGFGRDADPQSGRTLGLQVSLFDVSDPANPVRLAVQAIHDSGYGGSLAEWDHLAFSYFAEQGIMAVPVTVWKDGTPEFRLKVIRIEDGSLKVLGSIAHDGQVLRSLRIGEYLYSLAEDGIKVAELGAPANQVASLAVEVGADPGYRWWGIGGSVFGNRDFIAQPAIVLL